MGCEMYGSTCELHFGFNRKEERERQDKALAELSVRDRELLLTLEGIAWRRYDWFNLWCPMWGGVGDYGLSSEDISKARAVCQKMGLSEEDGRELYNRIASSTYIASPCPSTAWRPVWGRLEDRAGSGRFPLSPEQDIRQRVPPHDGEVISLLMVRAGLEWLEHLKSQGKL